MSRWFYLVFPPNFGDTTLLGVTIVIDVLRPESDLSSDPGTDFREVKLAALVTDCHEKLALTPSIHTSLGRRNVKNIKRFACVVHLLNTTRFVPISGFALIVGKTWKS